MRNYRQKFVFGDMYVFHVGVDNSVLMFAFSLRFVCRTLSTHACSFQFCLLLFLFEVTENLFIRLCDSRKYTYFFPTYLLLPPKPGSNLERTLQRHAASLSPVPQEGEPRDSTHSFWTDIGGATHEEELLRKRAWRVGPDQIARLRATAQKYEGTHNFHNFTVGRDFGDRSNQRYMKKIEVNKNVLFQSGCGQILAFRRLQIPKYMGKPNGLVSSFMDRASCCTR